MGKTKPQEEVIKDFKKAHGDYYNYDKVVYEKSKKGIIITCPIHGDFPQTPNDHRVGKGCSKCGDIKASNIKRNKTNEELFKKFTIKHDNKYDYSKVIYVKGDKNITIICPIHGDFQQTPDAHKRGQGCPHCANIRGSNKRIEKTKSNLIKYFKKAHGDFYNYDKVDYNKRGEKITITCPIHGDFPQTYDNHKKGHGCSKCNLENSTGWGLKDWINSAKRSKNFDSFKVYILKFWNEEEEFYKIGRTFRTVKDRFKDDTKKYKYEILEIIQGTAEDIYKLEVEMKRQNREFSYIPKNKFGGMYECFSKNPCTTKNKDIHL